MKPNNGSVARQREPKDRTPVARAGSGAATTIVARVNEALTIPEVIAELRVSRSTFYFWRQTGKAPRCIKLPNGDLRVRRADLDDWLTALEDAA